MNERSKTVSNLIGQWMTDDAGRLVPTTDEPVFAIVLTRPAARRHSGGPHPETVGLLAHIDTPADAERQRWLIDACEQAATERGAELRLYIQFESNQALIRPGFERLQHDLNAGELDIVILGEDAWREHEFSSEGLKLLRKCSSQEISLDVVGPRMTTPLAGQTGGDE